MKQLLEGDWQKSVFTGGWTKTTESEKVIEPATGKTLAEVGLASDADVNESVDKAAEAQREWAAISPVKRADVFFKAINLLEQYRSEFERWLVLEIGSTPAKAAFEVILPVTN